MTNNMIIFSSIPDGVLWVIVIAAIIMMILGVFLTLDTIKMRLKEKKNEGKTFSTSAISNANDDKIHLEYLEKLTEQEKQYVALLERELELKAELKNKAEKRSNK